MKVAIVHDWLYGGGAEKVVEALHDAYPEAPIYTTFATDEWRTKLDGKVVTGILGKWPLSKLYKFLPLFQQWWFAGLDLSDYDVVISSCGNGAARFARSKGKKPLHIAYTHTPTHYYWRKHDEYVKNPSFRPKWLARLGLRVLAGYLRKQDYKAAQKVDYFIANSQHIADDIRDFYGRDSTVIHPPVDTERFEHVDHQNSEEQHYVMWGRHVPYKRFDIAVGACNKLGRKLVIVGSGPDTERLKQLAETTVKLVGRVSDEDLNDIAATATAFIAPMEEDFGIAPVEAMAAGLPVIAYKAGGALDYVVEGSSGVFFDEQSVDSLVDALERYESMTFDEKVVRAKAREFSAESFKKKIEDFVSSNAARD